MLQETNRIEFKSTLNDKLEKEIVAFLNSREGGILYIGLDDDGHPTGTLDLDETQLKTADRIRNNILPSPMGLFDICTETVENIRVVKVLVSSGLEKPYYIRKHGMSPTGCFYRIGSSSQPMTTSMIDDLYAKRAQPTLRNITSPRQDLSFEQLRIYYQERGLALNDQFAASLELLTPEGKYNYIAYLLADENGVSIKIAKYAGRDKVDLIVNEEYGYCSLIKAANKVLDRMDIENTTHSKITSKLRIDKRLVEPVAMREAIINAIVHNDFSREIPPVFEIFSDRMEMTSYGGLIPGQSEEDFFSCWSMPRNRELMRIFRDCGMVEQLGSEMSRILRSYDKSIYQISEHFIKVVFPFEEEQTAADSTDETISNKQEQVGTQVSTQVGTQVDTLTKTNAGEASVEQKILSLCEMPHSKAEIAEYLGYKSLKSLTQHYIRPLLDAGKLAMTIPDKPNSRLQKYITIRK